MIKLAAAGEDRWHLPRHAHVVIYEHDSGDELLTMYDCGAAQSPPAAQFIGHLVNVAADASITHTPTATSRTSENRAFSNIRPPTTG